VFRPERRREEQDIPAYQIFDRIKDARMRRHVHESGEAKVRFETQKLAEPAALGLEPLQSQQDFASRALIHGGQGTEVARLPKLFLLSVSQHLSRDRAGESLTHNTRGRAGR
ncbi:MAG: hypothetical protein ACRD9W_17165, partial [Terriglobia bacterium]